ncbi:MAG: biotin/lipoyl-binding protein [Planctomycetota bacterium]|nr:biotin/lipoyl-binding protein [Planctomycetota bacterium]
MAVCVAALCFAFGGNREEAPAGTAPAAPGRPETVVQFTSARDMEFVEAVSSDGALRPKFSSLVSSRISGVIDCIFVREGDRVEQGRTRLFRIDDEKLRQAVEKAGQSLAISKSTLDEKRAGRIKADADLRQAEKDFARAESLYERKVIPLSEYELAETRVVQLRAGEKVAEANVALAGQNVALAEISLRMAEKDLRSTRRSRYPRLRSSFPATTRCAWPQCTPPLIPACRSATPSGTSPGSSATTACCLPAIPIPSWAWPR